MSTIPWVGVVDVGSGGRDGGWTSDDRAAALAACFRNGSRHQARRLTGVPERTLSTWLSDPRFAIRRTGSPSRRS